jgi:hypothetical protein
MMILTIHNLAKAYKVLPCEALARSNTFDLYVLDVATKWQLHQQKMADQENKYPGKTVSHNLSVDDMKAMIERVRTRSDNANIQKAV